MKTKSIAIVAVLASTLAFLGCAGETGSEDTQPSSAEPTIAGDELQALGVHYFDARGTAENATITFFDDKRSIIGGAQLARGTEAEFDIRWKGVHWEFKGSEDNATISKDGTLVDGEAAKAYEEAESATELAIEQANLPSAVAHAEKKSCLKNGSKCGYTLFGSKKCCAGSFCTGLVLQRRCYPKPKK